MSKTLCLILSLATLMSACAHQGTKMDSGDDVNTPPEMQWPVYGATLTQKFRPEKRAPYRRRHRGVDLAAIKGTPIHAVDYGRVIYAGSGYTGYGRLVILQHANQQYRTYYAHLSRFKVGVGSVVKKGDILGYMGNTGRSTGVHLHFEVRRNKQAVNPLDYLPPHTNTATTAKPNP